MRNETPAEAWHRAMRPRGSALDTRPWFARDRIGSWFTDHIAEPPEVRTYWRTWSMVVFGAMLFGCWAMYDLGRQLDEAKSMARAEYIRGWDEARCHGTVDVYLEDSLRYIEAWGGRPPHLRCEGVPLGARGAHQERQRASRQVPPHTGIHYTRGHPGPWLVEGATMSTLTEQWPYLRGVPMTPAQADEMLELLNSATKAFYELILDANARAMETADTDFGKAAITAALVRACAASMSGVSREAGPLWAGQECKRAETWLRAWRGSLQASIDLPTIKRGDG